MERRTPTGRLLPITGNLTPRVTETAVPVEPLQPAGQQPQQTGPIWQNRSFSIFWGGQTLASLGNMFALIATPLLVFQATGQVVQMGLVTATFTISQLIAGTFAGQLIDTLNRRLLMIFCDAGRALLFASIPLAWLLVGPQVWLIYVVTACGAVLGMVFQVGFVTTVANLVEKEQIITANGYINASMAITAMIGPLLGGVAVERFGPAIALSAQAAAFAVSALSLLLVRLRPAPAKESMAAQQKGLNNMLAGVRFLFEQPVLRAVTAILLVYGLATGAAIGFVFAASSIGAIIGSLGAGPLRKRLGFGPTYLSAVILTGVPLLLIGLIPDLYVLVALATFFQLVNMVMGINSMSLRQEITPDALLGRVTSAFWTISGIMTPLGAAAGTALAARLGAPVTFVGMGALICLIGLGGFFTRARERRPAGSAIDSAQPKVHTAEEPAQQKPAAQVAGA